MQLDVFPRMFSDASQQAQPGRQDDKQCGSCKGTVEDDGGDNAIETAYLYSPFFSLFNNNSGTKFLQPAYNIYPL